MHIPWHIVPFYAFYSFLLVAGVLSVLSMVIEARNKARAKTPSSTKGHLMSPLITLSNGAKPLTVSVSQLGHPDYWAGVVLARYNGEYVTWAIVIDAQGRSECSWGSYFRTLEEATADFRRRATSVAYV